MKLSLSSAIDIASKGDTFFKTIRKHSSFTDKMINVLAYSLRIGEKRKGLYRDYFDVNKRDFYSYGYSSHYPEGLGVKDIFYTPKVWDIKGFAHDFMTGADGTQDINSSGLFLYDCEFISIIYGIIKELLSYYSSNGSLAYLYNDKNKSMDEIFELMSYNISIDDFSSDDCEDEEQLKEYFFYAVLYLAEKLNYAKAPEGFNTRARLDELAFCLDKSVHPCDSSYFDHFFARYQKSSENKMPDEVMEKFAPYIAEGLFGFSQSDSGEHCSLYMFWSDALKTYVDNKEKLSQSKYAKSLERLYRELTSLSFIPKDSVIETSPYLFECGHEYYDEEDEEIGNYCNISLSSGYTENYYYFAILDLGDATYSRRGYFILEACFSVILDAALREIV